MSNWWLSNSIEGRPRRRSRIAGARRLSLLASSLSEPVCFSRPTSRVAARNELVCIGRVAQFLPFGGF
jgi:hypothetical protein